MGGEARAPIAVKMTHFNTHISPRKRSRWGNPPGPRQLLAKTNQREADRVHI